jgi:broad specificity phosphatase PhoE
MNCVILMIKLCLQATTLITIAAAMAHSQESLSGEALVTALRRGGYNIYFRHAPTDWSQNDQVKVEGDWASCDPQRMRQLSADGRAVARRVGAAIRRLAISVGQVLASEYCRTRETAELMGLGPVRATRAIINMRVADFVGGPNAVIERARRVLATPPQTGTNTILVAHGNLMRAVTGAYSGEAGAGIFLPRSDGSVRLVAQLSPEEWERLAGWFGRREE